MHAINIKGRDNKSFKKQRKLKGRGGRRTNFAGGDFAGFLDSLETEEEEDPEAKTLFVVERLSFKSTVFVSEKTLFPFNVLLRVESPSFPLRGRPSRSSVSSKWIMLYLSLSASIDNKVKKP